MKITHYEPKWKGPARLVIAILTLGDAIALISGGNARTSQGIAECAIGFVLILAMFITRN
jgi:hypothetical protein